MQSLTTLLRLVSALLSVYMLLIIIRVLLTWFQGSLRGKPVEILESIVDPYLNWFRRFTWLKIGMLDLSPVAAIILLGFVMQIIDAFVNSGKITIGFLLAMIISALWNVISFVLQIVFIMMLIRFVATFVASTGYHPFLERMDGWIRPLMQKILRWVTQKPMKYQTALGLVGTVVLALLILGNLALPYLGTLLYQLPF